jgi:two-component system LytT family response regulator
MKKRISLSTKESLYLLDPDDIMYCKCNNALTSIFLKNDDPLIISKGLSALENLLEESGFNHHFIRTHQSYLVNRNHILRVDKTDGYSLILSNHAQIPVSTRRRKEIINIIRIGV